MTGSLLFAAGSTSTYAALVGSSTVAMTFFVGSIFFTSAAYMQLLSVMNAAGRPWRFWAWEPQNRDWLASAIQLVGTVLFNLNTFDSLLDHLSLEEQIRFIWVPDLIGSICFLVASWLALKSLPPAVEERRMTSMLWWIAALNMLGSITFGLAAAGALFQLEGVMMGELIANQGTLVGAICFFFGAWLVLPLSFASSGSSSQNGASE